MGLMAGTRKQRILNRVYGDWHAFVVGELGAGKSIDEIIRWFADHDGIEISNSTLYRWLALKESDRSAA